MARHSLNSQLVVVHMNGTEAVRTHSQGKNYSDAVVQEAFSVRLKHWLHCNGAIKEENDRGAP